MPWVLGGLFVGLCIWAVNAATGTTVVTRTQAPPVPGGPGRQGNGPGRPDGRPPISPIRPTITPVRPSAPGVDPGVTQALADAEAVHREVAPTAPSGPTAPSHDDNPIVTHWPATPPSAPVATSEPPRPPPPPPGTPSLPTRTVPGAHRSEHAVSTSHQPVTVVAAAHAAVEALQGGAASTDGNPAVIRFQEAYGHGLGVGRIDPHGLYGSATRHALSLILNVAESDLPAVR